jgi:hypothetical protein
MKREKHYKIVIVGSGFAAAGTVYELLGTGLLSETLLISREDPVFRYAPAHGVHEITFSLPEIYEIETKLYASFPVTPLERDLPGGFHWNWIHGPGSSIDEIMSFALHAKKILRLGDYQDWLLIHDDLQYAFCNRSGAPKKNNCVIGSVGLQDQILSSIFRKAVQEGLNICNGNVGTVDFEDIRIYPSYGSQYYYPPPVEGCNYDHLVWTAQLPPCVKFDCYSVGLFVIKMVRENPVTVSGFGIYEPHELYDHARIVFPEGFLSLEEEYKCRRMDVEIPLVGDECARENIFSVYETVRCCETAREFGNDFYEGWVRAGANIIKNAYYLPNVKLLEEAMSVVPANIHCVGKHAEFRNYKGAESFKAGQSVARRIMENV